MRPRQFLVLAVVLAAGLLCGGVVQARPGMPAGVSTVPLSRDLATTPYGVLQKWETLAIFDDSDDTLKAAPTYADAAVLFVQNAVSKVWFLTIPAALDDGTYILIIRDRVAATAANTDTDVAMVIFTWSKTLGIVVSQTGYFVSY